MPMNANHARLCPSPEWASYMQTEVLPGLTAGLDLGGRMLEVGPGPGATTDWLRRRVDTLVAVELEDEAVGALEKRFAGSNVVVVHGDGSDLALDDDSFDFAGCFTMLHHVPTPALQNRVLAEILRVLRPGGTLIASDSLPSNELHEFHVDDVYNPVEPATLLPRLQALGYGATTVSVSHGWTLRARKPDPDRDGVWGGDS